MSNVFSIRLTICFEEPYWIGVFERTDDISLEVCRVVFGAEPKDCEVYEFIIAKYNRLKFSKPVTIECKKEKQISPKRLQRKIKKLEKNNGISTKAQEAIRIQRENKKDERKKCTKEQKELDKRERYSLKQEKKKKKKKGH